MNEIKSLNMSHLSEDAYVSKIEKTEQTDNVKRNLAIMNFMMALGFV
jgi:hypothetical protein